MSSERKGNSRPANDLALAVGVFWLLVAIYTLTYVGAFKSNDERLVFGSVDSWLKRGDLTTNQIYWAGAGRFNLDGEMIGYFEPGQMIAAVPFYLWGRALGAAVQGAFFLNVFVTAGCGALLYLSAIALGYQRKVALITTLLYGLATPAWAYSRYFFREPLTTLGGMVAFYALLRYGRDRGWRWLALAGFGIFVAMLTKLTSAVILPSLILLAFSYGLRLPRISYRRRVHTILVPAALVLVAVLFLVTRTYRDEGVLLLQRLTTHAPAMLSAVSDPRRMLISAFGLTFSPYKGLFIYAPILILGLVAYPAFWRRHRREASAIALLLGTYLIGYMLYPIWWGGLCWGPRFLVPVIPFLMLVTLPWIERAVQVVGHSNRRSKGNIALLAALIALSCVSIFIQLVGIGLDPHISELRVVGQLLQELKTTDTWQIVEMMTFDWNASPILGQARLIFQSETPLDFAWVQERYLSDPVVLWSALSLSLLWLALALVGCGILWRKPRWALIVGLAAIPCFLGIASIQLLDYRDGDRRFDPYGLEWALAPAVEYLNQNTHPDDILIVNSAFQTDYFLNRLSAPLMWYGLAEQSTPLQGEIQTQIDRILARGRRVWLMRGQQRETDEYRGLERYLVDHAYKVDERQFENWSRVMLFLPPRGQVVLDRELNTARNDNVRLEGYSIRVESNKTSGDAVEVSRDTQLELALRWQGIRTMGTDYTVFVQLLDENNQVHWQKDRFPGDGVFPTSEWVPGEIVSDNYAFALDLVPGRYRLITGMYDLSTMERLMWGNRNALVLAKLTVTNEQVSSDALWLSLAVDDEPAALHALFCPLLLSRYNSNP